MILDLYRFAAFQADFRAMELRKHGLKVKLQEQPLRILQALLERPGELVMREELRERLWPKDLYVDFERNLTSAMNKLRVALNDSAEKPRYIETLPRRGYRFIAEVQKLGLDQASGLAQRGFPQTPVTSSEGVRTEAASPTPLAEAGSPGQTGAGTLLRDPVQPSSSKGIRPSWLRSRWAWAAAILFVAAGASAVIFTLRKTSASKELQRVPAGPVRIAVLPFVNLTGDQNKEYLSDGMTEEMITVLGSLSPGRLGVIARTSSMTFKNSNKTAAEIGQSLNVNYLLECSVRETSPHLHINAQLIRTSDQVHVWAQEYDREMPDVVNVQEEVATAIAREIQIQLPPSAEGPQTASHHTVNPKAFEAYAMGRFFWNKRNEASTRRAIGYFEQAIHEDPAFARAYAGLADSYIIQLPDERPYSKSYYAIYLQAKNNATKAIELDDSLAEAHTSLAFLEFRGGSLPAAEKEFRRALQLDPAYATAHHWYAFFLGGAGRIEEARMEFKKALESDPLSVPIHCNAAMGYVSAMQDNGVTPAEKERSRRIAQQLLNRALELDPDSIFVHGSLALLYSAEGKHDESTAEFQRAAQLAVGPSNYSLGAAREYFFAGKKPLAEGVFHRVQRQSKRDGISLRPWDLALTYLVFGDKEHAFFWLDRALRDYPFYLASVESNSTFEPLRSDPRYAAMVRKYTPSSKAETVPR